MQSAQKRKSLVPWIKLESQALNKVAEMLTEELSNLSKKAKRKNVHQTRVALRHWFALWSVLGEDGWKTYKLDKKVMTPLKKLLKRLGAVRDIDVNIKIGKELNCPRTVLKKWKKQRKKSKDDLVQFLDSHDLSLLIKRIDKVARNQPTMVSEKVAKSKFARDKSSDHTNGILLRQVHDVEKLAHKPSSPRDFHKLRLAVKQWRYLLSDLCGVSDPSLESAQTSLGQLHDLDRIRPLLEGDKDLIIPLANLNKRHRELLSQLYDVEKVLPFNTQTSRAQKG